MFLLGKVHIETPEALLGSFPWCKNLFESGDLLTLS